MVYEVSVTNYIQSFYDIFLKKYENSGRKKTKEDLFCYFIC